MNCKQARKLITYSLGAHRDARRHVEECPECSRFLDRATQIERSLQKPLSSAHPPGDFARRVRNRLTSTEDLLAWAALRLLPATLMLVLLLSWLNLSTGRASGAAEETSPADAVVSWVLDPIGGDDS